MKRLKLDDPNKQKLSPWWLEAVTSSLSKKYGVKVMRGESWAIDIKNKIMTYNDSVLQFTKEEALALVLHEIGHLTYTTQCNQRTHIFSTYPESSHFAINCLEDFRIDFIMGHEYQNSNQILSKLNEQATIVAYEVIEELQTMQKKYDEMFAEHKRLFESKQEALAKTGTPMKQMDDTDKFMEIVRRIGYRPRLQRPAEEIMYLVTLLYHSDGNVDQYQILKNYQNPHYLTLAEQILPLCKDRVEHFEDTRAVQDLWELEVYPLLKDLMEQDAKNPQHQTVNVRVKIGVRSKNEAMSKAGQQSKLNDEELNKASERHMGGQEEDMNRPDGAAEGGANIREEENEDTGESEGEAQARHAMTSETRNDNQTSTARAQAVMDASAKKNQNQGGGVSLTGSNDTDEELDWDKYKREIKPYLSTAKTQLNRALKENEYKRFAGKYRSGSLNIKKLYKFPMNDFKLFQKQTEVKGKDYAFTILIDVSGSMSGDRLEETMRGVVLMTEVLNKLEQRIELCFFSDRQVRPKTFDTVINSTFIGQQATSINGGGTSVTNPFKESIERVMKQPVKEKIMITLTDGEFYDREESEVRALQAKYPDVLHYGIGINVDLKSIFKNAININNVSEIMPAFATILRRHIKKL